MCLPIFARASVSLLCGVYTAVMEVDLCAGQRNALEELPSTIFNSMI